MIELYYCNISKLMTDTGLREKMLKKVRERRRAKALRYAFLDDQCRSLAAGLCLKYALEAHHISYQSCVITEGAKGKLSLQNRDDFFFSLSHTGDYAICAVSDQPIGVDMESLSMKGKKLENLRKIASSNFTADEQDFLASAESDEDIRLRFARVFTGKEAYGKLLGVGLSYRLNEFSTMDNPFLYNTIFDSYMICLAMEDVGQNSIKFEEVVYA